MIVPQFWAEGRIRQRVSNRQVTVRRFGWSDESQAAAQAHADARTAEALARVISGERLERREPKFAYNGAEGVPIREEIVSKHGECVVTRNSYGAMCLNTPNVFFADIDFGERFDSLGCGCNLALLAIAASIAAVTLDRPWSSAAILGAGVIILAALLYRFAVSAKRSLRGGEEQIALARVRQFIERHPEWNLRLYRTPAGLRLLALHKTFDPTDSAVDVAFQELNVDPIYAQMCVRQRCFRARVSPKPWRIGITEHLRPRPGVWPVAPERMAGRTAWIQRYDEQSRGFAACTFIESLGSHAIDDEAQFVQELHDDLCQACTLLPIA